MTDPECVPEERVRLSNYGESTTYDIPFGQTNICDASAEIRKDLCDNSSAVVEHMQDPRKFYAPDSPVFNNNSDSDQDLYKSAEETLKQEDQSNGQVGGNSVGLYVSFAWPVSASINNPKVAATV